MIKCILMLKYKNQTFRFSNQNKSFIFDFIFDMKQNKNGKKSILKEFSTGIFIAVTFMTIVTKI